LPWCLLLENIAYENIVSAWIFSPAVW